MQEEGAHFGGFNEDAEKEEDVGDDDRKRSKAEVMREVMAKSKLAKYERQQTRMADDDIREELDNELSDLRSLLFEQSKEASKAEDEPVGKRPLFGDGSKKKDEYDAAVREMAFERRAKPQDRLKTEEEKAEELAEKLKKAEENRLKRMRGEEPDVESKRKSARIGGGDDLEDDFELDGMTSGEVYGLGQGLAVERDNDDDDASADGDEDAHGQTDEEQSEEEEDEEDDFADLADPQALAEPGDDDDGEELESDDERALTATIARRQSKHKASPSSKMLPFTFPCPATHDELLDIIEANQITAEQVPIVLKRIRALYHASLAEDNKFKLQAFLGVLLDHLVYVSASVQSSSKIERQTNMQLIDSIVVQIFSLAKVYPLVAAQHFMSKLALMQRNLTKGLTKGPTALDSKTWPGLTECILLKVTSTIWPTSDRAHPVATPLSILINQYLSGGRVRNLKDLTSGLFLCCLSYNNEQQSKRLLPETLNFLHNAITLLAPIKSVKSLRQVNQSFGIPWPDFGIESSKQIRIISPTAPAEKVDLLGALSDDESNIESLKASLLQASLQLVTDFAHLYTGSVAFVELFEPFHSILKNLSVLQDTLEMKRKTTFDLLSRLLTNAKTQRRFLRLQAHRAIAIASHVPKFDQGFNPERRGGKSFDPDTERAEQAKLRALLKKERKGAIRELRRDNDFLTNEKRKEREEEDTRYKKTMDKIVGSLSTERGEQKKYLQDKQRLKKRSGKK